MARSSVRFNKGAVAKIRLSQPKEAEEQRSRASTAKFIRWITPRRGRILEAIGRVKWLADAARQWATSADGDLRHEGTRHAYAWNRLTGISFALWRALPLLGPTDPKTHESKAQDSGIQVDHAEKLLVELLLHNRVTYEQDRSTRDWMAGFYLNCAEDRIRSVLHYELRADVRRVGRQHLTNATAASARAADLVKRDKTTRMKRWDEALLGLGELSSALLRASRRTKPRREPRARRP